MHPILFKLGWLIVPSNGACAAMGVLLALLLVQLTAPRCGVATRHAWNAIVLAVFALLALTRLVLIVLNLSDLRRHPAWLTAIAMVHHPLLTAVGVLGAGITLFLYSKWQRLPLLAFSDCLAAPFSLIASAEQLGALLVGSDYGRETASAWAVTYTSPLAARWSGTPLGIALEPAQAYAAAGALLLAGIALGWMFLPRRGGDVAGVTLIGAGILLFITEMFRDWEGRGVLPDGLLDIPQLVGLGMVVLGGALLFNWRRAPRERSTDA